MKFVSQTPAQYMCYFLAVNLLRKPWTLVVEGEGENGTKKRTK